MSGPVRPALDRRTERLGLLFAGLCALNGAFVPAVAKLTTNLADPVFVAAATTAVAALAAGAALLASEEWRLLIDRRVGPRLLLVGAFGTAAAYVLLFSGTRRSTAIETVICLQAEPAYALIGAWLALGHRPTSRRIGAILVLLTGILLAVGGGGFSGSSGIWLLLGTPLCWQTSHLIALRGGRSLSPRVLTGARYLDGGLLLIAYLVLTGGVSRLPAAAVIPRLVPLLIVQGLVLFYAGTLFWYQAITRLDLARSTAIVVPTIPLLSLGASFLLLREVPTLYQGLGLLLTAGGVLAFATAPDANAAREAVVAVAP